jgi:5-methylcytosine-specific restriction endonuclease McrA
MDRIKTILLTIALLAIAAQSAERNSSERAAFMRLNPCPSTGEYKGKCPGYQVDHIIPLKCGGADAPHNMQWLTIADHKAKTAREAKLCGKIK